MKLEHKSGMCVNLTEIDSKVPEDKGTIIRALNHVERSDILKLVSLNEDGCRIRSQLGNWASQQES